MNRGARTGLGLLAVVLLGVAVLGATGVVRIPWLSPVATTGLDADRPDDLAGSDAGPGRELAASGGRAKTAKPGESAADAPVETVLPSEATGTAIGKVGGSIRGRVVEGEAKRPVAGATVELLMPEALFHYLKASSVGRFDRLTVMTDKEGRFSLSQVLPSSDYALRVRKGAGPYATKRDVTLSAREVLDVGDVILGPSGGLSGRVVGGDGKGLADARIAIVWKIANDFDAVMADPDTLPWVEAWAKTDADGAWKAEGLEPGDKSLVVKAPSGAADVKASVAVVAGTVTPGIDWTLGGALAIAGRVEWADGKPIEGARVFAKTMRNAASFTGESGADGSFRLVGLLDGVYFVGAFIPGMSVQLAPGKKPGDENVRLSVALAGALSGRVVSKSTGRPIPQFKLTPVFADAQDWMQRMVGEKFDKVLGGAGFQSPEGTFRFDRLKSGNYTLHVEAEGYPPTDSPPVEVIAGAEAKAGDVALPDGNRISGLVIDSTGKPIADATIVILNFDEFNFGGYVLTAEDKANFVGEMAEETRTDERGAFTTSPLTPRSYDLGVRAKGYLPSVRALDVSVKSVDGVELRLEGAGAVSLHTRSAAGKPIAGVAVFFCDSAGATSYGLSGPNGVSDRTEIRPGRWVVIEYRQGQMQSLRNEARTDRSMLFERIRALSGATEFSVVAGERIERSITVAVRAGIVGRVRVGSLGPSRYFALKSEADDVPSEYVGYDEDGAFKDDAIPIGSYRILVPSGPNGTLTDVGVLDVPEGGLKGVEIDLSK